MQTFRRRSVYGFTLIELMITVGIIAILAAVAIPSMVDYLNSSRSSEAVTVLLGIREGQMAYHADVKDYAQLRWMPYNPSVDTTSSDYCGTTHMWDTNNANFQAWIDIFQPSGPTYYTYESYSHSSTGNRTPPAVPGTKWPTNTSGATMATDWFVAHAWGDIDCDGTAADFWISSHSRDAFKSSAEGEY